MDNLNKQYKIADEKYHEVNKKLSELTDIYKELEKGEASLQKATDKLIGLPASNNINAAPICDLVEVSDKNWQCCIKRLLCR